MRKECISCGKKTGLLKLKNGAYACTDCLDVIAKEQKELRAQIKKEFGGFQEKDVIKSLINIVDFANKTTMTKIEHLLNALWAINYVIEIEEGMIEPDLLQEMQKILEKWQKDLDNQ